MRSNFLDFSMACFFLHLFHKRLTCLWILFWSKLLESRTEEYDRCVQVLIWPIKLGLSWYALASTGISRFLRLQPFQWKVGRQPPKSMIRVAELPMIKKKHLPWIFRIQGDSVKQLDTIPSKVVDRVEGARLWSPFQLTSSWCRFPWQIHLLIDFAK